MTDKKRAVFELFAMVQDGVSASGRFQNLDLAVEHAGDSVLGDLQVEMRLADTVCQHSSANSAMAGCSTSWSSV
jgi:hypothetical protein